MFRVLLVCFLYSVAIASVLNTPIEFIDLDQRSMKNAYLSAIHTDPDVSNLTHAKHGDFPWHATLAIKYSYNTLTPYPTYYSAVILNENWIIASAKVIVNASSIRVDVGSINIKERIFSVYPDAYTLHPEFDLDRFENNIALLRLSGDNILDYTNKEATFAPIRLPQKRQINESFMGLEFEAHLSSFMFSKQNSIKVRRTSEYLLTAKQKIVKNSDCAVLYEYFEHDPKLITEDVICAKSIDMEQGHCIGDAGAPLIVNKYGVNTLIGLLSSVKKDGSCHPKSIPDVFTRITSHYDWIARVTAYQFRP